MLNNLGNIYTKYLDFEKTIKFYNKALMIAPTDEKSWINLGWSLYKLEQYSEALNCYGHALKVNPNRSLIWFFPYSTASMPNLLNFPPTIRLKENCYFQLSSEQNAETKCFNNLLMIDNNFYL